MTVERGSFVGQWRENAAMRQFLESAHRRYAHSDVIAYLADALRSDMTRNLLVFETTSADTPLPFFDLENWLETPRDRLDICDFVVNLAEAIVQASGSGLFGRGRRVSESEERFMQRLREALSLPPSPN